MNLAIVDLTKNYAIASFKPHLNYHECHISLVISQKTQLPIKVYLPKDPACSFATSPANVPSSTSASGSNTPSSDP
jgi:hypothetical protein